MIIKLNIKIKADILILINWQSAKALLNIKTKYNIIAQQFAVEVRLFYINIDLPIFRLVIKAGIYYNRVY